MANPEKQGLIQKFKKRREQKKLQLAERLVQRRGGVGGAVDQLMSDRSRSHQSRNEIAAYVTRPRLA